MFKAIHKESGQVVAIKQVPVESDLQEIIKEISIMQQCDRFSEERTLEITVFFLVTSKLSILSVFLLRLLTYSDCFSAALMS